MVDDNTLLERRNVVKKIVDHRGNAKIITGLGSPTYDVFDAGDSHSNFYLWGGMGGTAMIALIRVVVHHIKDHFDSCIV